MANVIKGSDIKFGLIINDLGTSTLSSIEAEFYVQKKRDEASVKLSVEDLVKLDDNEYAFVVPTSGLPTGTLMAEIVATYHDEQTNKDITERLSPSTSTKIVESV